MAKPYDHYKETASVKHHTQISEQEDTAASEAPIATKNAVLGPNVQPPQALVPQMQSASPLYPYQYPLPLPCFYGHPQIYAGYMHPLTLNYLGLLLYIQKGGLIPLLPQIDLPARPPCTALELCIPLANFCLCYEISKSDEDKLALLECQFGNEAVLPLTDND